MHVVRLHLVDLAHCRTAHREALADWMESGRCPGAFGLPDDAALPRPGRVGAPQRPSRSPRGKMTCGFASPRLLLEQSKYIRWFEVPISGISREDLS